MDQDSKEHDDYHDDGFHLHVLGVAPEVGKLHLFVFHILILVYFAAITVVLLYHTRAKPQINNSVKVLRC